MLAYKRQPAARKTSTWQIKQRHTERESVAEEDLNLRNPNVSLLPNVNLLLKTVEAAIKVDLQEKQAVVRFLNQIHRPANHENGVVLVLHIQQT